MCVIASKTTNAKFPSKETLEICWNNNPDGAGYMFTANGKVHIRKGFMKFDDFWNSLQSVRTKYGDKIACVMHFRIGTQGGNIPQNTHPFPLSRKMDNLRKLNYKCDIGVAHNGIIDLTTTYAKNVNYSDTMKFITDYLSLIIHDTKWYKSKDTCKLIERLIGSRLCVLDKESHITLLGEGWNKDDETGVWYSNTSWKAPKYKAPKYNWNDYGWGYEWDPKTKSYVTATESYDEWDIYFDETSGQFDFDESYCPGLMEGSDEYCSMCANRGKCMLYKGYEDGLLDSDELNK